MSFSQINWRPDRRACRQFGLGGLAILGLLGLWVWVSGRFLGISMAAGAAHAVAIVLWSVAELLGVLAIAAPAALRWPFVALSIIAWPIGWAMSYVLVVVLFYGVFTPVGVLMRLLGWDAMARRFEPGRASYWVAHGPPAEASRYFRQS
jgi:hypothetical protein